MLSRCCYLKIWREWRRRGGCKTPGRVVFVSSSYIYAIMVFNPISWAPSGRYSRRPSWPRKLWSFRIHNDSIFVNFCNIFHSDSVVGLCLVHIMSFHYAVHNMWEWITSIQQVSVRKNKKRTIESNLLTRTLLKNSWSQYHPLFLPIWISAAAFSINFLTVHQSKLTGETEENIWDVNR